MFRQNNLYIYIVLTALNFILWSVNFDGHYIREIDILYYNFFPLITMKFDKWKDFKSKNNNNNNIYLK